MARLLSCLLLLASTCPARAQDPAPAVPDDDRKNSSVFLTLNTGGHTAVPLQLQFTTDGTKLVSTSGDRTVQVWDTRTGERLQVIRPPLGPGDMGTPRNLVLDPKGERLAFWVEALDARGEKVRPLFLCSLRTGEGRALQEPGGVLAFSPDGDFLAVASGPDVILADVGGKDPQAPGQKSRRLATGAKKEVVDLAFSPGGKLLAAATDSNYILLLDVATGRSLRPLISKPRHRFRRLAWADDSTLLAGDGAPHLEVWDVARRELKQSYAPAQLTTALPEGDRVLSSLLGLHALPGTSKVFLFMALQNSSQWADTGCLFDWATGELSKGLARERVARCPASALAPDGKLAALGQAAGGEIVLFDPGDGAEKLRLRGTSSGAARPVYWTPDGKALLWSRWDAKPEAGGGRGLKHALDLTTLTAPQTRGALKDFRPHLEPTRGPLTLQIKDHLSLEVRGGEKPVAYKSEKAIKPYFTFVHGNRAALSNQGLPFILVIDTATGKLLHKTRVVNSEVSWMTLSPDGRYLLVSSPDQTLVVFNPVNGKVLLTVYPAAEGWIAWTPEGYYAAASPAAERLVGWQVNNGPGELASYYPVDRFRTRLFRPDVIKLLLEKGSVEEALKAADGSGSRSRPDDVRELLPPRASLAVLDQSSLPQIKLRARATASGKGQPVTALRLLVDGRPLPEGAGHALFKGRKAAEAEWTLTLPPGKHSLSVLARSPDASSVSPAVEVACPAPPRRASLHLLAVGIDAYEDSPLRLAFAAADARAIADAFRKHCRGALFPTVTATALVDRQAGREAVLAELAALRKRVSPNDLVVVFFAGHGVKEKEQFYLLTVEARTEDLAQTALSGEELRKALAGFPCQVLLLLDACHSSAGVKNFRPAVDEATRTLTDDECGVAVLCAAMAHEKAVEQGGNGLFTRAVVEALGHAEGVPFDRRDRRLYIHHLHAYVLDEVRARSGDRQHPFLSLPWVVESFPVTEFGKK